MLSDGVTGWRLLLVLGQELVCSHWAIGWSVRPILFATKDFGLLLRYERSSRVYTLLLALLSLCDNVLGLLDLGSLQASPILALDILQSLFRLPPFDPTVGSSSKCSTGVVGYGWRWSLHCDIGYLWLIVLGYHDAVIIFVLQDLHWALFSSVDLWARGLWKRVKIWIRVGVTLRWLWHHIVEFFHQNVIACWNFMNLRFLSLILFCNCFFLASRSLSILEILGRLFGLMLLVWKIDVWVVFQATEKSVAS